MLCDTDAEFHCYSKTLKKLEKKMADSVVQTEIEEAELELKAMRVAIIHHIDKVNAELEDLEGYILENNYEVFVSVRVPSMKVFDELGLEQCADYQSLKDRFY